MAKTLGTVTLVTYRAGTYTVCYRDDAGDQQHIDIPEKEFWEFMDQEGLSSPEGMIGRTLSERLELNG